MHTQAEYLISKLCVAKTSALEVDHLTRTLAARPAYSHLRQSTTTERASAPFWKSRTEGQVGFAYSHSRIGTQKIRKTP